MNIQAIVNRICEESDYNREAALPAVIEAVATSDELRSEALRRWCSMAVSDAMRDQRSKFFRGEGPLVEQTLTISASEAAKRGRESIRRIGLQDWYQMRILPGVRLGSATIEDMRTAYDIWAEQAKSNQRRADWAGQIIAKMKAGKTVQESLTLKQIDAISKEYRIDIQEAA